MRVQGYGNFHITSPDLSFAKERSLSGLRFGRLEPVLFVLYEQIVASLGYPSGFYLLSL